MILRLDWPDSALWPNRSTGKHWTDKHEAKVAARDAGFYAVKQARSTQGAPKLGDGAIPLSIVFCASTARRHDLDGALSALKPSLDGIAKALGIDDSQFNPVVLARGVIAKPGVVIVAVGVQIATSMDLLQP